MQRTGMARENLGDLARATYAPFLADKGLSAALEAQARQALVPQEIEAAVYFFCLETLQDAAKYASASHVFVVTEGGGRERHFEVADNGTGVDPATTPPGSALKSIADRLGALGCWIEVRSACGNGTAPLGRVPGAEGGRSR